MARANETRAPRCSPEDSGPRPAAAHPRTAHGAWRTAHCEVGQITLEYVLLLAAIVLPLVGVVYMLWEVLMYFYWNTALVVSIPYL